MPGFTAVIVLHDSEPELRTLLDSFGIQGVEAQLVVVDSGSRDGGADLARGRGCEVVVAGDVGFGAACNAGVARAREDVVVLLNPDCELVDDSLTRLAETVRARPEALHAPRLLNPDGSVQRSAHPVPGTWAAVAGALVYPPVLPRLLRDRLEPYRSGETREVGWAIAACLAGSTDLLRRLGPFDPAVRLFAEDMELCLRAPTVLHPELRVRHAGGHAVLRKGEPLDLLARRRREAIAATLGPRAVQRDDLAQALTFATRAAGHAILGGDSRRPRAQLAALRRARAGRGADVLALSYAGVLGGAERVLLDWLAPLHGPVVLACPDGPLAAAARARGIEVEPLPDRSLRLRGARLAAARSLAGLTRDVFVLTRQRRPRVLVASGQRAVLASVASLAPVVALHHDLPRGPLLTRAVRWATSRADAAVAVSQAVADAVGPAEVIHPGVDLEHWRLPAPPAAPRALVLGALVPWKRADLALEIAARIPDLELELVGAPLPGDPPAFTEALRTRAARADLQGRVSFTGALADPRPALGRARVLLHCADEEPYGLAIVEALAAGRPVVAPRSGGPKELLPGDWLYTPGDAADGARVLQAVLAGTTTTARAVDAAAAARRFAATVGLSTPQAAGPP